MSLNTERHKHSGPGESRDQREVRQKERKREGGVAGVAYFINYDDGQDDKKGQPCRVASSREMIPPPLKMSPITFFCRSVIRPRVDYTSTCYILISIFFSLSLFLPPPFLPGIFFYFASS